MAKIAISLPDEVFADIERERLASGETRSEFLRRTVEMYFRSKRKKEEIDRYVRGYLEHPETEEALAWTGETMAPAWAESPWEDDSQQ
jgi:metal-responsive CopG/Arc/MetJ family transcriptional regulator